MVSQAKTKILITGSSGYVGSFLLTLLKERFDVTAIDMSQGADTDIVSDIAADDLFDKLSSNENYIVIHCAAARYDYGISANVFFEENVSKITLYCTPEYREIGLGTRTFETVLKSNYKFSIFKIENLELFTDTINIVNF